ncbi:MAG: F0F1 ATP synthase subunit delta [Gammaproteobacteria bacterium]|jgi:F-type H+-transporting ATPase subunit delta|uniref:ATP synthase subunit delta n=1 Tax=Rheinheimera soli TaxID=443616 RepID=A0ABU1W2S7_9GAMM|nr:F0F1 ATP synthase subunit delta [Rheinheimera soli]MBU1620850.1 F0F1 ATP synthase subunit delta [Gammaproteobacteria bacterium]MBU2057618.1 F0F1 ATP synthase subunit delta [Gammaproteobacteria bacterium]MBU2175598.1 F0F1 ATP synthase subunit delta [Gammaproteobacteria bacterium]MBU2246026.1 F0F1 ATP synthase subunit delta [Gammaproteobacteria bacterium]MBU2343279.1 F0F1 ATP synthase subunit delta [Gammaproteobacteria bacterium]
MSKLTIVARPYAKAAFDVAVEQKALDSWATMLFFAAEVAKTTEVASRLHALGSSEKQADFFIKVCAEQLNSSGQNLIRIMAENHRLLALPEVFDAFIQLKAEYEKEATVEVVSATELDAAQQAKLVEALSQRLARKVKLNCSVDPAVVGGMVIKSGDMVIDGSVRGKLHRLATALQS